MSTERFLRLALAGTAGTALAGLAMGSHVVTGFGLYGLVITLVLAVLYGGGAAGE